MARLFFLCVMWLLVFCLFFFFSSCLTCTWLKSVSTQRHFLTLSLSVCLSICLSVYQSVCQFASLSLSIEVDWLHMCSVPALHIWFLSFSFDWLTDWLIDWLIDWLTQCLWVSLYLTLPYASLCNSHFFFFSLFLDCWYIHVHELYQSSYMCEWNKEFLSLCLFRYMSFLLRWVFPCRCDLPLRCGELNCLVTTTVSLLESSLAFLLITIFSFFYTLFLWLSLLCCMKDFYTQRPCSLFTGF